ncbi:MAG TPA: tetratricopeptide repeat protein [Minicystis sp.]|nr:tetratricopeptide repeat protein [Minicystis sp.]
MLLLRRPRARRPYHESEPPWARGGGVPPVAAVLLAGAGRQVYDGRMGSASRLRGGRARLALALVALSAFGCGGAHDATEKELADLRTTVTKLRADEGALAERLDALENARAAASAPGADRPDLDVVHLAPETTDAADGDAPRPVIRATGVPGKDRAADVTHGPERDYRDAAELARQHRTDKAIAALSAFLSRYPDDAHAEAATFLRAEAYASKGDQRRAVSEYEALVARWPNGAHAPEALSRAAQGYARLGDKPSANEAQARLLSNYPTSDAAKRLAHQGTAPKPK